MKEKVLLTGISGFIARHIALALLKQGYAVRGTIRQAADAEAVRIALAQHGADVADLEFAEADLTKDDGWKEAVQGCSYVQHVASPFPIEQPRDREALVPAARDGAMRVLTAGFEANVQRIVFTSSMVAMMYRADRPQQLNVTEEDWSDPEWKALSAYIVSKTRAEEAVWQWADRYGWRERLSIVNPGFVLGPALGNRMGTSLNVIQLIMEGAYPAVPPVYFPVVDVRDLAEVHVKAMTAPEAETRRLIAAGETVSFKDMGHILKKAFPERAKKIPTGELPAFFVRFLSNFDRTLKSVTADLGVVPHAESAYVSELTGITFRPAHESVIAAGQSLIDNGVV